MPTVTSRIAYKKIAPTLGSRQEAVLNALVTVPDATNQEIADTLAQPINRITPRMFELRELGKVEFSRIRLCSRTGHTAKAWKAKR